MPKIVPLAAAVAALAVIGVALAGSAKEIYTYKSALASGGEVPKPSAPAGAKGAFTATVTENGTARTLRWKLTFQGLSGKAMAAHIHKGKAGVAGAVIVPLCGPCRTGQTGQLKISTNAADALERGLAYVNVHTTKNAGGEIRGQVKLVSGGSGAPPPSTEPASTTPDPGYDYGGSDGY